MKKVVIKKKIEITKTTIQIEKKTLDRLKKIKIAKRETYDEILNRMIDSIKKNGEAKCQ